MEINHQDRQFLKKNRRGLYKIWSKWIEELEQEALSMGKGEERDTKIAMIQELRGTWLNQFLAEESNKEEDTGV